MVSPPAVEEVKKQKEQKNICITWEETQCDAEISSYIVIMREKHYRLTNPSDVGAFWTVAAAAKGATKQTNFWHW